MIRAFARDAGGALRAFAQDVADGAREFGHDIAAPFKDALWLRRERKRLERGE
jgi:hypothetical protein